MHVLDLTHTRDPLLTHPSTPDITPDINLDINPDINVDVEPDPDSERLVPYEPGYVDGKGPRHAAALRQVLTTRRGTFHQRIADSLPALCLRQILATYPPSSILIPTLSSPLPTSGATSPSGCVCTPPEMLISHPCPSRTPNPSKRLLPNASLWPSFCDCRVCCFFVHLPRRLIC